MPPFSRFHTLFGAYFHRLPRASMDMIVPAYTDIISFHSISITFSDIILWKQAHINHIFCAVCARSTIPTAPLCFLPVANNTANTERQGDRQRGQSPNHRAKRLIPQPDRRVQFKVSHNNRHPDRHRQRNNKPAQQQHTSSELQHITHSFLNRQPTTENAHQPICRWAFDNTEQPRILRYCNNSYTCLYHVFANFTLCFYCYFGHIPAAWWGFYIRICNNSYTCLYHVFANFTLCFCPYFGRVCVLFTCGYTHFKYFLHSYTFIHYT